MVSLRFATLWEYSPGTDTTTETLQHGRCDQTSHGVITLAGAQQSTEERLHVKHSFGQDYLQI